MIQDPQNEESLTIGLEPEGKRLSRAEFQGLSDMPPELEWFANLDNPHTRRAYRIDVKEFTAFAGVMSPEEMRQVTRAHLIAWRKDLERRGLAPSSIRRKLAAVASLFDHLCEVNAVSHNPVRGVKRPKAEGNEGKTPALSRRPSAGAVGSAPGRYPQGQTRPGHPGDRPPPRLAPRGIVRPAGARASKAAKACPTCAPWARAQKCGMCRPTRWPSSASTITSRPPATARTPTGRCFGP